MKRKRPDPSFSEWRSCLHNPGRRTAAAVSVLAMGVMLTATGCSGTGTETSATVQPESKTTETSTTTAEAEKPTPEPVEGAVAINIDPGTKYQQWKGWGIGLTWYSDRMVKNQKAEDAYDLLFDDLGITTLRFRNTYLYGGYDKEFKNEAALYEAAKKRAGANGEDVTVLLSSWSPCAALKSNGSVSGDSTLAKDENGNYRYDDLGEYFADTVEAYRNAGVDVNYLSIQNEPDYSVSYDCCLFDPEENEKHAGYSQAFLATYDALEKRFGGDAPKLIGPETMTAKDAVVNLYMKPILETRPETAYGICHHLYDGGSDTSDPSGYWSNLAGLNSRYPDEHKWMTEFYNDNVMQVAGFVNRALTVENVESYMYWDGVWDMSAGLIGFEPDGSKDFKIHENYYGMKHFSAFIRPGYYRIDSKIKGDSSKKMQSTTFASEDLGRIAQIIVNPTDSEQMIQLMPQDYEITDVTAYLSICGEGYDKEENYPDCLCRKTEGPDERNCFTVPARSIVTFDITGKQK